MCALLNSFQECSEVQCFNKKFPVFKLFENPHAYIDAYFIIKYIVNSLYQTLGLFYLEMY